MIFTETALAGVLVVEPEPALATIAFAGAHDFLV